METRRLLIVLTLGLGLTLAVGFFAFIGRAAPGNLAFTQAMVSCDNADVSISGVVTSGVWSGVITMTGDVVINAGEIVTIAPGTEVHAATTSDYHAPEGTSSLVELIVLGRLVAEGTNSQPITLTSAVDSPEPADWYGVRFLPGSGGLMEYTVIECGVHGLSLSDNATLTVRHGTIQENTHRVTSGSAYAAGIYASGNFTLTLEDSLLVHNLARVNRPSYGNVYGGDIYLNGGDTIIRRTQILTPAAALWSYGGYARGGGIYAVGNGTLTIEDSRISGHRVHGDFNSRGGGLFLNHVQTVIHNSVIVNNTAEDEWGGTARGGGIYITGGTPVTITHSTIARNWARRYSGAAAPVGAQGGGIDSTGELYLSGCVLRDNLIQPGGSGRTGRGAGIYIAGGTVTITDCLISGNEITATSCPGYGGGVYVGAGQLDVLNTSIVDNRLTPTSGSNYGGGIYVAGGTVSLVNDTIIGNQVDNDGGGVYVTQGTAILSGTHVLSNLAGDGGGLYLDHTGAITATDGCVVNNSDTSVRSSDSFLGATDNWWGTSDGPSGAGTGSGDSVSARVDFSNYKTWAPPGCPTLRTDLIIHKTATPPVATAGQAITYTLVYSNVGLETAYGVLITDVIPISVTSLSYTSSGAIITPTAGITYAWMVQDLAFGEGGVITITGALGTGLPAGAFVNTAVITATVDANATNNTSSASVTIRKPPVAVLLHPPRNSHTAPPTTTVSITYDEPISAATVTSRTFAVHGMQSGLVTATPGVRGGKIIVTPTCPFHQGELVYAIATTGTLGLDGAEPLSATQWQFNAGRVVSRCFGGFADIGAGLLDVGFGSAAWGDYDNDGDLDILLTGASGSYPDRNPVSRVYRNNGPSANSGWTFTEVDAGLVDVWGGSVAWGDYDNDGDLDILLTGRTDSDNYVSLVYRNDAGRWDIIAGLPGVARRNSVAWGDYDNDGDLDILLMGTDNSETPASLIYRNDGPSAGSGWTFTDIGAGLTDVDVGSVAWGDYDNDGDLDILLTGDDNSLVPLSRVYRNDGPSAGSGWTFTNISAGLMDVSHSSVAWGDYDNDGDLDILLSGDAGVGFVEHPVSLVYRNDAGSFTNINAALAAVWYSSAAWGDYDNDGDLDILLTGWDSNDIPVSQIYRNDDGSFTDIGAGLTNIWLSSVAWGDYDNDGDLDILLTGHTGVEPVSRIYRNDNGSFIDIGAELIGVSSDSSVAWGDYDNDGDLDILLTGTRDGPTWDDPTSRVYQNDNGNFIDIGAELVDIFWGSVAWGDYDNDDDLDILLTGHIRGEEDTSSRIYRNDTGIFTDVGAELVDVGFGSVAWGDYDNDGDLDILLTGSTTDIFPPTPISKIYRNDDGSFTDISAGLVGVWGGSVAWGDYDNDGDLDILLTGESSSGPATLVYNNDIGHFTIGTGLMGVRGGSAAWGDYDNDGDLDILLTGDVGATYPYTPISKVYRNDAGSFTDISTELIDIAISSVAWGDYDSDGDLDILLTGLDGDDTPVSRIYRNDDCSADLTLVKTVAPQVAVPGDAITYTLAFSNSKAIATQVVITDTFPPSIVTTLVVSSGAAITDTGASPPYVWQVQDLAPGASGVITITGVLTTGLLPGSTITNTATISSAADCDLTNNTDAASVTVKPYLYPVLLNPPRNSHTAPFTTTVSITYDEPIDAATVTSRTFAVHGMQSGLVTATHGVRGGKIIVTPTRPFHQGELVYAIATTGTLGLDGAEPVSATQWQFNAGRVVSRCFGGFTALDAALADVLYSSVAWGDYDGDGDLDILFSGMDVVGHITSRVYRNDDGSFTSIGAGLMPVYLGSAVWGDYDSDGDLDILLTGLVESGQVSQVYRNDGGSFTDIGAGLTGVWSSSVAWGDYDNDGDLDILLTGFSSHMLEPVPYNPVSKVYRNDGDSFADIGAGLADVCYGSTAWGDYDNDGDLDILLTGSSADDPYTPVSRIYRNDDCPSPDLALVKTVTPQVAAPGDAITYTLSFSNSGTLIAAYVVITDVMPVSATINSTVNSGAAIVDTGISPPYVWQVQDLAPGESGVITITGVLSSNLPAGAFANTAIIAAATTDSDPSNNSGTAVVTVANVLPVAANDDYTTDEDTPLMAAAPGILDNDTDANDDLLTAVLDSGPAHGTLNLNTDGSFTYTPTLNFNGVVTFTYHAHDGMADSNVATVTITVTAVNDVPVAASDNYTIGEDTPLEVAAPGVLGNDTDADGDPLAAVLDSGPVNGTLTLNPNGSFVYTPTLNFGGVVTFTYHADDGTTNSNAATVTIIINENPVAYAYLPLILKNYIVAPDLVGQSIAVTSDNVQVVVKNQGNGPVNDEFWVDIYVNPDPVPAAVNEIWHDGRSDQGLAWAVIADALPLAPGDVLTLTVGDAYYSSEHSWVSWPLPADASIYAQVDSYNAATTYGAVLENHEMIGGDYNNIKGPVYPLGFTQNPPKFHLITTDSYSIRW